MCALRNGDLWSIVTTCAGSVSLRCWVRTLLQPTRRAAARIEAARPRTVFRKMPPGTGGLTRLERDTRHPAAGELAVERVGSAARGLELVAEVGHEVSGHTLHPVHELGN